MRQLRIDRSITPRNEAALNRYFTEVERFALISPTEEVALAERIRQGDRAAGERLVTANLRFVVSVAKKYQHMGMPFSDLIAEGNLGLIRAAGMFDHTKGFKFISYAVWWIRQSILLALTNHIRTIRLSGNMSHLIAELREQYDRLEQRLERQPTDSELAEAVPKYDPREPALQHIFGWATSSLDASHLSEDGEALIDYLADAQSPIPDAQLEHDQLAAQLHQCLSVLEPTERLVIEEMFGLNSLGRERLAIELADTLGINSDTVARIRKRSLAKLKLEALKEGMLP